MVFYRNIYLQFLYFIYCYLLINILRSSLGLCLFYLPIFVSLSIGFCNIFIEQFCILVLSILYMLLDLSAETKTLSLLLKVLLQVKS